MPGTPIALVLAQDSTPPAPASGEGQGSGFMGTIPMLLIIFVIFYFLMIRPQSKERRKREEVLKSLKKYDQVVTTAGIHGQVVSLTDKTVKLEVADGVRMEFDRTAIWQVQPSAEEAAAAAAADTASKEKGKA